MHVLPAAVKNHVPVPQGKAAEHGRLLAHGNETNTRAEDSEM
jgi:hypothetical protein